MRKELLEQQNRRFDCDFLLHCAEFTMTFSGNVYCILTEFTLSREYESKFCEIDSERECSSQRDMEEFDALCFDSFHVARP